MQSTCPLQSNKTKQFEGDLKFPLSGESIEKYETPSWLMTILSKRDTLNVLSKRLKINFSGDKRAII